MGSAASSATTPGRCNAELEARPPTSTRRSRPSRTARRRWRAHPHLQMTPLDARAWRSRSSTAAAPTPPDHGAARCRRLRGLSARMRIPPIGGSAIPSSPAPTAARATHGDHRPPVRPADDHDVPVSRCAACAAGTTTRWIVGSTPDRRLHGLRPHLAWRTADATGPAFDDPIGAAVATRWATGEIVAVKGHRRIPPGLPDRQPAVVAELRRLDPPANRSP